ncbi:MAG: aldo/keto reductase [Bacteroidales bacterium]|jgi:aryl-alcohol dehydrogenase-like predicted oxidoreductase|nr:aldo/keto reductase [Bacteroidales bacterium]
METRILGKTDIRVSEIAFGAWAIGGWMWGGSDSKDAVKAIETAIDNGMTTIDTASVYGFGLSEQLVGKAIRGKRDRVQVLTKFGMDWIKKDGEYFFDTKDNSGKDVSIYKHSSKKKVLSDCDNSLKRLNTDYIDLFQIHWPDATTPVSETMEALEMLVAKGKIRAGGVCNYSAGLLDEACRTFNLASEQVPYSMVRRDIEKDIVPYCLKNNISIFAYSPLQRGLLAGKIKPGHKFNEGDTRPTTPYYKEPNLSNILAFLEKLKSVAEIHNATLSQVVLNWTIQQPGITCALAGARNPAQVLENVGSVDFRLTADEISRIDKWLSEISIITNI